MTEVGVIDTLETERARGRFAISMLIWTLPQAAAIALAAGRIRLAASWPVEGEHVSLYAVAAAQLLFAPVVASRIHWKELLPIALAALPFSAIAALLGSNSVFDTARLAGVSIGWLTLNRVVFHFVPQRHQKIALAAVLSIVTATLIVRYLSADAGGR